MSLYKFPRTGVKEDLTNRTIIKFTGISRRMDGGTAKHTSWIMTANITISLFPWRMDAMVK